MTRLTKKYEENDFDQNGVQHFGIMVNKRYLEKISSGMKNEQSDIKKTNNHLSLYLIEHKIKRTRHMTLEIHDLDMDRHKHEARYTRIWTDTNMRLGIPGYEQTQT